MSTVIAIVFGVIAVICAIKCFFIKIAAKAVIRFFVKNGYAPPTPEELRACSKEVAKQMFSKKT